MTPGEHFRAAGAASIIATTISGITVQDWAAFAALLWSLWLLYDKAVEKWQKWQVKRHTHPRKRRRGR